MLRYHKLKLLTYEKTQGRKLSLSPIETITRALYTQDPAHRNQFCLHGTRGAFLSTW
ncbi:MAG: hypothetical protein G01um101466_526 [Parcubacteria group bacterium Gr01-1014_66]|nr:MAG: hypothetical protein G01um101466_526 [Parcubacteria group bacterium Gr01-1014_66]